jgi:dipeptidyl aminopeptidase/acylaminoacyl peptidase
VAVREPGSSVVELERLLAFRRFSAGLAFSPDGSRIHFVTNRPTQFNLWTVGVDGSGLRQRTSFVDWTVRLLDVAPDGTIAFCADHDGDELNQIFLLREADAEPERITDAPAVQHFVLPRAFSPDGSKLAYAANARTPTDMEVWVRDLASGDVRPVFGEGKYAFPGSWAPDGRRLLVSDVRSNSDARVYLVDLETGDARCYTADEGDVLDLPGPWRADGSGFYLLSDSGREFKGIAFCDGASGRREWVETPDHDVEDFATSAAGDVLAWLENVDGYSRLRIRRADGSTVTADVPLGARPHLTGYEAPVAVARDGVRAAAVVSTPRRPAEVWVAEAADGAAAPVTESWIDGGVPEGALADAELVSYPSFDGREIPAWLYRVPDEGTHPVVLSIHGGPEAQERPVYSPLYQHLVARGIAVLATNIRGSTGYGKSYQRLIQRDWGGGDLEDWEHAARWLRAQEWVDVERLGVYGASYGGFAVLSCVTRLPQYWAAAVDVFGPSNLITFARAVPPTWRRMMKRFVGDPDEDADLLRERSPLTYAESVRAPLLVIQGAKDPRVVKNESDQLVARLRELGRTVEYVVFDDEGHGFTKRENELAMWRATAAWFERHLLVR